MKCRLCLVVLSSLRCQPAAVFGFVWAGMPLGWLALYMHCRALMSSLVFAGGCRPTLLLLSLGCTLTVTVLFWEDILGFSSKLIKLGSVLILTTVTWALLRSWLISSQRRQILQDAIQMHLLCPLSVRHSAAGIARLLDWGSAGRERPGSWLLCWLETGGGRA